MKRCLKISFDISQAPESFLLFVQKKAKELHIEGTAQVVESKTIRMVVQGKSENVEQFVDLMHAGYKEWLPSDISEEPFLSNRDYRGTFRIIE